MLRLQDAQPNAWQGRLRQQWRQIPAKGCRVGRREGAAMMPPLGRRPASVRSTRPSLQLELQHHLRHRTSSWQTVLVSEAAQPDSHPVMLACGCAGKQDETSRRSRPCLASLIPAWSGDLCHCSTFCAGICLEPRSTTTPSLLPLPSPLSQPPPPLTPARSSLPGSPPGSPHLARHRRFRPVRHHFAVLSSKHGLPERISIFSSAARGWQHVAP